METNERNNSVLCFKITLFIIHVTAICQRQNNTPTPTGAPPTHTQKATHTGVPIHPLP